MSKVCFFFSLSFHTQQLSQHIGQDVIFDDSPQFSPTKHFCLPGRQSCSGENCSLTARRSWFKSNPRSSCVEKPFVRVNGCDGVLMYLTGALFQLSLDRADSLPAYPVSDSTTPACHGFSHQAVWLHSIKSNLSTASRFLKCAVKPIYLFYCHYVDNCTFNCPYDVNIMYM